MKNLIYLQILLFTIFLSCNKSLSAQNHFNSAIGIIDNGVPQLTVDDGKLKNIWSQSISANSNINQIFSEVSIKNDSNGYYLIAKSPTTNSSSSIKLINDNGTLYEAKSIGGGGTTVTCSGCKSTGSGSAGECEPRVGSPTTEIWYCTDCSKGDCTKSTTTSTKPILDGIDK